MSDKLSTEEHVTVNMMTSLTVGYYKILIKRISPT